MSSTFHGLETSLRGLRTHQGALQTTGHNISNASTPGYSRQRVNFSQTEAFPAAGRNQPAIPGQIGTGVEAGSVQRVRESFLDLQFRGENTKAGYWSARSDALQKMEEIMNEPSDHGLGKTMDRFWQSLQDLAVNPENSGARSVVRERGKALAETFNYLSGSLTSIQNDIKQQIENSADTISSIAEQINNLNRQIGELEPHGYLPNDLYDKRDLLVDQLSELANVKVSKEDSGGNDLDIAEGKYTIKLVDDSGNPIGTLVDGKDLTWNELTVGYDDTDGSASTFTLTEYNKDGKRTVPDTEPEPNNIAEFTAKGKLKGQLEAHNTVYPEMLSKLDEIAYQFATAFNAQHQAGRGLDDSTGLDFFDIPDRADGTPVDGDDFSRAASLIKLDDGIDGPGGLDKIAASKDGNAGDGSNALLLADVKDRELTFQSGDATVQSFYEGIIGKMAVDTQQANRLKGNSETLKESVEQQRQSVSGVSLDEEMTRMIQFQHAYNASARNITSIDEMLDRIINGMGRVGR